MMKNISLRAHGQILCELVCRNHKTSVYRHFETNGLRLRFPQETFLQNGGVTFCEGVMLNTSGGMACGDSARYDVILHEEAIARFTTQSPEKIYRRSHDGTLVTKIETHIQLAEGATLFWLPQETLIYNGANLERRFFATMAKTASLVVLEMMTYGRFAMGEERPYGNVLDQWQIIQDHQLVHAEAFALKGDFVVRLSELGSGHKSARRAFIPVPPSSDHIPQTAKSLSIRCTASLVLLGQKRDDWRAKLNQYCQEDGTFFEDASVSKTKIPENCAVNFLQSIEENQPTSHIGISHFANKTVIRFLASEPHHLRRQISQIITVLTGHAAPRVWQ